MILWPFAFDRIFIASMMALVASKLSGAYVAFAALKCESAWYAELNDLFVELAHAQVSSTLLAAEAGVVPWISAGDSEPSPDMTVPE